MGLHSKFRMGDVVTVYKGRKVPIGTTGRIFWQKAVCYGKSRNAKQVWKCGIETRYGDRYFTYENNCTQDNLLIMEAVGSKIEREEKQ